MMKYLKSLLILLALCNINSVFAEVVTITFPCSKESRSDDKYLRARGIGEADNAEEAKRQALLNATEALQFNNGKGISRSGTNSQTKEYTTLSIIYSEFDVAGVRLTPTICCENVQKINDRKYIGSVALEIPKAEIDQHIQQGFSGCADSEVDSVSVRITYTTDKNPSNYNKPSQKDIINSPDMYVGLSSEERFINVTIQISRQQLANQYLRSAALSDMKFEKVLMTCLVYRLKELVLLSNKPQSLYYQLLWSAVQDNLKASK